MDVDTRKVWISYNVFTVVCIWIILFVTVYVWVNSSKYPLIRLEWNLPPLFSSWWRKHHEFLFYFCKIVRQYNRNKTWNLIRRSMLWESSVNLWCDKYDDWLNGLYKLIHNVFDLLQKWIIYNTQTQRDIKYEILARHISPQIEDLDIRANYCKTYFLSSNHQKLQWIRCNEEMFFVTRT